MIKCHLNVSDGVNDAPRTIVDWRDANRTRKFRAESAALSCEYHSQPPLRLRRRDDLRRRSLWPKER